MLPFEKPIVSPVLIGRAPEVEMLESALYAAQRGTGQCIVIAGEAGIGKSRLLSEIRHRAEAGRFLILQGYCFEQDLSFPYAPLVDALRAHLARRQVHRRDSILIDATGCLRAKEPVHSGLWLHGGYRSV